MLASAPAARARCIPVSVAAAMASSVRLLLHTWNTQAPLKQAGSKSVSANSRSAAGGR